MPQTGWLKPQTLTSHSSVGWEVQDQGVIDSILSEGPFPGLQKVTLSLYSHMGEKRGMLWSLVIRTLSYYGSPPHDLI